MRSSVTTSNAPELSIFLRIAAGVWAFAAFSGLATSETLSPIEPKLRLEYELTTRIARMNQTASELRTIIEALPGPGLTAEQTIAVAPATLVYASPIDETLARVAHLEQLIADITRIISALPFAAATTPKTEAVTASVVAPAVPPVVVPKPAPPPKPAMMPVPTPPPLPTPISDALKSTTTIRGILLLVGGLFAAILAIAMRRRFLRRRPSRKQLAASIETPLLKDEALELADVMTSMGMAEGAAQTLVESIRANPRQALTHWLRLLDVYRQTGKQAEFEKAAGEMRAGFNVEPGSWDGKNNHENKNASLENYPHIAGQLKKLWPTSECAEFLLSLLADNRDGKRAGFPLPVVEEIVLLLAILRTEQ